MELLIVKRKQGNLYLCNNFPHRIKNGKLEYLIYGEGYKKTKSFAIVNDVELPERWSEMSWLDIAKLYDGYGVEVANEYAECKVAGIVSRQTARGYGLIYAKIKSVITDDFDHKFFEMLRSDYMMSCFGMYMLDVVGLDKALAKADSEYDNENCLYQGQGVSMSKYIEIRYGKMYVDAIAAALKN